MSGNIFKNYWTNSIINFLWYLGLICIIISLLLNLGLLSLGLYDFDDKLLFSPIIIFILHLFAVLLLRFLLESTAIRFEIRNELMKLNEKEDIKLHLKDNNDSFFQSKSEIDSKWENSDKKYHEKYRGESGQKANYPDDHILK